MSKLAFSKLGLKINNTVDIIFYNELSIEVKKYLPINDKLELISDVINKAIDDNGYYNEGKIRVFFTLAVVDAYTNLTFTEKQKEDPCKLYDLLISNDIWEKIWNIIPTAEKEFLETCLNKTIHSIYEYKNSMMGIMDNISRDYNDLDLNAQKIHNELTDPESLSVLKDVLNKLG